MPDPLAELIAQTSALVADKAVAPATKRYGAAVTAWAQDLERRIAPAPPSAARAYAWDATAAHPLPNQASALLASSNLWGNGQAALGAEDAVIEPPPGTPLVQVTWRPGWQAPNVFSLPIPAGTKPGGSSDHHLAIIAPDGRHYGTEEYDPATQSCSGFGTVPAGAVSETRPGGSNASRLDLSRSLSVEDVLSGQPRTLLFGMRDNAAQGNPCVYPADTDWNDPLIPYGQWLRLDPEKAPPSYPNALLAYVDLCLRRCGMVLRDQAQALTIYARDYVNAGGNVAAWQRAGVTLDLPGGAGYPIGCYLPGIPWSQLQALEPPPRIA